MSQISQIGYAVTAAPLTEKRDVQTYAVIGAAMAVLSTLGTGFLEPVYQEALAIELRNRAVPFQREVDLPVYYEGERLVCAYRADFICNDDIIVELKAQVRLTGIDHAQVLNYLKATGLKRALLINFGSTRLEYKRMVR
jgi:GxxExxY protein